MTQLPELERRRLATAATLRRYGGSAFEWRKSTTCLHMARFQMRQMGHKPPRMPPLRSALRARRELDARGHPTVIALMDSLLPRIAPAEMLLGDLAAIPGDAEDNEAWLDCLLVNVAPRKFAGWHPDQHLMAVLDIDLADVTAAWRL
jgi:hypothetical protein